MSKYPVGPGKKKTPSQPSGGKNESDEDLVLTPGGPRPRKLVQPVKPGEAVRGTDDGACIVPPNQPDSSSAKEKSEND
jgi:hypothetical protein